MSDTSPDVEKRFRTMMASRTPEERLRMASRMFSTARVLVLSGAGADVSDGGRRQHLFLRFYARDFSESDCGRILHELTKRPPHPVPPQGGGRREESPPHPVLPQGGGRREEDDVRE